MSDDLVCDLAIAYVQVKLSYHQKDHPEDNGYSNEIRQFLKWYHFARLQIPKENADIDLSALE